MPGALAVRIDQSDVWPSQHARLCFPNTECVFGGLCGERLTHREIKTGRKYLCCELSRSLVKAVWAPRDNEGGESPAE